ncbi:hypothetical protein ACH9EU_07800 [Kocuria sp. M1R5S2]|uniref:hypothetical protein n=1 Tax=Kocuria rhizosphaerae TaxID=3376285 RepID=UPI0037A91593
MSPVLLLDPGFYVRPVPDDGPAGDLGAIGSRLVFEAYEDAARHLRILTERVDPVHMAVPLAPLPVPSHVPGVSVPGHVIGFRLTGTAAAVPDAADRQVAALKAAVRKLGMISPEALEALAP